MIYYVEHFKIMAGDKFIDCGDDKHSIASRFLKEVHGDLNKVKPVEIISLFRKIDGFLEGYKRHQKNKIVAKHKAVVLTYNHVIIKKKSFFRKGKLYSDR